MTFGVASRVLGGKPIPDYSFEMLSNHLISLWLEMTEKENIEDQNQTLDPTSGLPVILFGLFIIEASQQREKGFISGSKLLSQILLDPILTNKEIFIEMIIKGLERTAYQGYVEFAITSITNDDFKLIWSEKAYDKGILMLSNLRSLYQEKVDNLLMEEESVKEIWNQVKIKAYFPAPNDLLGNSMLWSTVAISVNVTFLKITGMILLELAFSESSDEFWRRSVKAIMAALSDSDRIGIAHIEYGLALDPNWDLYDELEISHELLSKKLEIHQYYKKIVEECIAIYGRGILYER
jgi:hypothetical protein